MGPSQGVTHASETPPSSGWKLYLGTFAVFAVLYAGAAQQGVAWQDSGTFQLRCIDLQIRSEMGLALSHPLLIALGKLFSLLPFGPLAWRINLVAALAGALTVANITLLVRRLVPHRPAAALIAGATFGLAHTPWWLASVAESQLLFAMLFTLNLHLAVSLVRRPREGLVVLLGLINGLALTAHNLALLAAPVWVATVLALASKRDIRWRSLAWLVGGWGLGASAYLAMIASRATEIGAGAAIHSALFGELWVEEVFAATGGRFKLGLACVGLNFPNLTLPLAAGGLWAAWKRLPRTLAAAFTVLTAVYFLFAVRYEVADQFMFFLPFYAMVAVLAGVALGEFCPAGRRRWLIVVAAVGSVLAPALLAVGPWACEKLNVQPPGRGDLAYRDTARYWLHPWKCGENSAERYGREAILEAPAGAVILVDSTIWPPLRWMQRVEGLGADVTLLLRTLDIPEGLLGREDVFLAAARRGSYPKGLDKLADFRKDTPESLLYRVVWRGAESDP
jgi:hypothetical protein